MSTQAYRHSWDQQHFFYYHKKCVEQNPPGPEVTFELIEAAPQGAICYLCYKPIESEDAAVRYDAR